MAAEQAATCTEEALAGEMRRQRREGLHDWKQTMLRQGKGASSWIKASFGRACLDTVKCFDSVSLHSFRVLLRHAGAPDCMFNVLNLEESLVRHVWTFEGPTGVVIKAEHQKGF